MGAADQPPPRARRVSVPSKRRSGMNVDELLPRARDGMTASRGFAEPCLRDGVTVIPSADTAENGPV